MKTTYLYNKIIYNNVIILHYITAYAGRFQLFQKYNTITFVISDSRDNF
jgi:hypothetical protein